ncbi:hypothetical protein PSENEW3_00006133 [Picochlorum sp. SENEW3]|nr:hypothetical protein PSENEW3_00006133 [Picochlorum sp. SENEW3]
MPFDVVHPNHPRDFAEMGQLMAEGFPAKCRHVGMSQERAKAVWEQIWLEVNPACIGVVRDPQNEGKLAGMIVIKFHPSKEPYYAVDNPKSFFGAAGKVKFPVCLRLRVSKIETMFSQAPWKKECYVVIISVSKEARGRGVGQALMAWAEEQARAHSCRKMTLHVEATNRAIHLYQREGFRRPILWMLLCITSPLVCLPISGTLGFWYMVKRLR